MPAISPARTTAAAALAVGLVLAVPAAASAHVTVSADNPQKGGYAKLVFRVPTESDTATTTKLVITLPKDTPLPTVRTKPKPGWVATVTTAKLAKPIDTGHATLTEAPATVTYTAAPGGGIAPGQFDEFELSTGPLPESADTLRLPTAQYYSDGTVVRWDQAMGSGGAEPEHPAPELTLLAATGDHHGAAAASGEEGDHGDTEDGVARGLGIAGLVVAVLAAGLGLVALLRGRRRAGTGAA
ncbi:MAG TPA: YcnI family protein [Mycobacteriales bacterium]|jgi:uncharacterized protein YcnI|nr:YcnI family protein [Mycobacteriales bacterium]